MASPHCPPARPSSCAPAHLTMDLLSHVCHLFPQSPGRLGHGHASPILSETCGPCLLARASRPQPRSLSLLPHQASRWPCARALRSLGSTTRPCAQVILFCLSTGPAGSALSPCAHFLSGCPAPLHPVAAASQRAASPSPSPSHSRLPFCLLLSLPGSHKRRLSQASSWPWLEGPWAHQAHLPACQQRGCQAPSCPRACRLPCQGQAWPCPLAWC